MLELATQDQGSDAKQLEPFTDFAAKARELVTVAQSITVADEADKAGMLAARKARLSLKDLRCAVANRHKELKADILKRGNELDAGKRELLALIEPLEDKLLALEEFAERADKARKEALNAKRIAELAEYTLEPHQFNAGAMTEEAFRDLLAGLKAGAEKRLADAQKAKADADAKAKADAEEAQRIRLENERLKAEAESERQKRLAEQGRAEAALAKERAAREAVEAEAKREREAEAKAEADRIAAAESAAAAPDKQKLLALAQAISILALPDMATPKGKAVMDKVREQRAKFSAWVTGQATTL